MIASAADTLTHVELIWIEKRIEHWIRFGHDVAEQILDRRRRVFSFAPDSIFAFVRWEANDFGTVVSRIDILRAVAPAKATRPCRSCAPAARFFYASPAGRRSSACCKPSTPLRRRRRSCRRLPDHWRHVHNRLTVGDEPRRYTREQHGAWLCGKGLPHDSRGAVLVTICAATVVVVLPISLHPGAQFDLERQRQRPDRALRRAPEGALHVDRPGRRVSRRSRSPASLLTVAICRRACRC